MEVFDQIPTDAKQLGDPRDGHPMQKIEGKLSKACRMSRSALHKGQHGPPESAAFFAPDAPDLQTQPGRSCANGNHSQDPLFGALAPDSPATMAFRAPLQPRGHLSVKDRMAVLISGPNILDSFKPKGMIEKRGGHG